MKSCLIYFQFHFHYQLKISQKICKYAKYQIIDLQSNTFLKKNYDNFELSFFHSKYIDMQSYPNLRNNALKTMSLFGSTYTYEHIFSRMKIVKSKT